MSFINQFGTDAMFVTFKKSTYLLALLLCLPIVAWGFDEFDCVGTEPAWSLTIRADKFTFKQQAEPSVTLSAVEAKPATNMKMDHIRVFRTKLSNKDVIIIIQKQSCTDGTSEEVFEYEGLYISTDKVFHGCCTKKLLLSK